LYKCRTDRAVKADNAWRKQIESKEADEQDMKMLEDVENRIKAK
jgi:hypothetical protein